MSNKYISEQSNQFKNKIIIVTGSTQGSGAETAKLIASRGAKGITICGRNSDKGNKVKSEIESMGAECMYIQADLEKLTDCKKIISLWCAKVGGSRSRICCAARGLPFAISNFAL